MLRNTPHRIGVYREQRVSDAGGGFTTSWALQGEHPAIFGVIGADEVEIAQRIGADTEASVRVRRDADVRHDDRVQLVHPDDAALSGDWNVDAVRWNRDHLRLMLSRVT